MNNENKSLSVVDILKIISSFIFPISWSGFYFKDKNDKNLKIMKYLSIGGGCIELIVFLVSFILSLINPSFAIGTINVRTIVFWIAFFFVIQFGGHLYWFQRMYIKDNEIEKENIFKIFKAISAVLTVIFSIVAVYYMDAVMDLVPMGILFDDGIKLVYKKDGVPATIAFYALFILTGAAVAYFVAVNKAAKYGHKRDIFETLLLIALPMGIIGARLWWVISEWNRELAHDQTLHGILNFRDGGLAVQGGVLLGAFAGIWYVIEKKREIPILRAVDVIIPGILLAQAIGRLGNFTNVEVFGAQIDPSLMPWLPNIVVNQFVGTLGYMVVPLFLIEGLLNVLGYLLITYVVGGLLKKYIKDGDLAGSYFIWYGILRFVMEPLRNPDFIMGTSLQMSLVFVCIGVLAIVINHVIRHLISKNKLPSGAWKEKYIAFLNSKSDAVKMLLALPIIDGIIYGLYRIAKGHYFTGVVWFIIGASVGWIFDLLCLFLKKPLWMSKPYV